MRIEVGQYNGTEIEVIVLKYPEYVAWILRKECYNKLAEAKIEIMRLIEIFDRKPITKNCMGHNCTSNATRCTVFGSLINLYWWCDSCDPLQSGALAIQIQVIKKYGEALRHVELYCGGHKKYYRSLIGLMAKAKGLPNRVDDQKAINFFQS